MASFAHALLTFLAAAAALSPAPAMCYVNPGGNPHLLPDNASAYPTRIVLVRPPPDTGAAADEFTHRLWHESFLPTSLTDSGEPRLVHSYTEAFSGFAARLTDAELDAVAEKPGFVRAFPERRVQLMTTRTPALLGLEPGRGAWNATGYGEGAIIGFLDTGIDEKHPSFRDEGMPPPPARWKGACQPPVRCNNKLIGAASFVGDNTTADDVGHGTHTTGTAAGRFVEGASAFGLGAGGGTAAGMAPGAHLAVYKVWLSATPRGASSPTCWPGWTPP